MNNQPRLQIKLLGELAVTRNGKTLSLPPSKKTRALLAFLALNPKQFHRDYLCELFWEIPDDPRGSLRWSLSKIRKLVDDDNLHRLLADRNYVRLDAEKIDVDVNRLLAIQQQDLAGLDTGNLATMAEQFSGQLLEGLELTNFYQFNAWCIGEREQVVCARTLLQKELVQRLYDTPEQALPYARAMVLNNPYDEELRAELIKLLATSGRGSEAEQQYHLGMHLLGELGVSSSGLLFRAWRGVPGGQHSPAATSPLQPTRSDLQPQPQIATLIRPAEGRQAEITTLQEMMKSCVRENRAQFALIAGAPGMGKSHLLNLLEDSGRELYQKVLRATAIEFEVLRPFALWQDTFVGDARVQQTLASDDSTIDRDKLLALLSTELGALSGQTTLVLLDDIQWCDESSATALAHIALANRRQPLLIVLAGRDTELTDNSAVQKLLKQLRSARMLKEITLKPLSDDAIEVIIRRLAPELAATDLSMRCGGNPLMAIEIARAVAAGGNSGSLDETIKSRLESFDLPTIEILRWASVLGRRIDLDRLMQAADCDSNQVGKSLHRAESLGLVLSEAQGFRFSHDLIAKSIYNEISPGRQKVMHRRVAQLLEENASINLEFAADLAYHALLSGDAELGTRALVLAGRLCLRFFAHQDALNLAGKGMQLAASLEDSQRICRLLDFHDIRLAAAPLEEWDTAAKKYVELAEQALDHGEVAHARLGYTMASYLRWAHGQWSTAREQSLQAERITRSGTPQDHVIGMAEAARCLAMLEQDLGKADAMLMEAKALAKRGGIHTEAIPAAGGMLLFHQGHWSEAEEHFLEARALAKSAGDRINEFQANEYLAMIDIEQGHFDRARTRCCDLLDLAGKLREGSEAPLARSLAGLCSYAQEDCTDDLDQALEELRMADAKHRLAYTLNRAAIIDSNRQRLQAALSRADEALQCASVLDRATEMLMAHTTIAQICRQLGDKPGWEHHRATATALNERNVNVARWATERAKELCLNAAWE